MRLKHGDSRSLSPQARAGSADSKQIWGIPMVAVSTGFVTASLQHQLDPVQPSQVDELADDPQFFESVPVGQPAKSAKKPRKSGPKVVVPAKRGSKAAPGRGGRNTARRGGAKAGSRPGQNRSPSRSPSPPEPIGTQAKHTLSKFKYDPSAPPPAPEQPPSHPQDLSSATTQPSSSSAPAQPPPRNPTAVFWIPELDEDGEPILQPRSIVSTDPTPYLLRPGDECGALVRLSQDDSLCPTADISEPDCSQAVIHNSLIGQSGALDNSDGEEEAGELDVPASSPVARHARPSDPVPPATVAEALNNAPLAEEDEFDRMEFPSELPSDGLDAFDAIEAAAAPPE